MSRPEDVFTNIEAWRPREALRAPIHGREDPAAFVPAGEDFPAGLSVIVLTYNEELNLARALSSVSGSSDVVVLDSGSMDRTVQIAQEAGARVFSRTFDTSARQRQWALDNIDFRFPWLFVLDADEWVSRGLADDLRRMVASASDRFAAGWCRTRYVYEGRWIPAASLYPSWTMRLLRVGRVHYEDRAVNAHPFTDGSEMRLTQDLVHEDRRSLSVRMQKLERYARLEALEQMRWRQAPRAALQSASTWRRRIKIGQALVPFGPSIKALVLIARGGILEGRPGWHYIEEQFIFERMTRRYIRELEQAAVDDV